MTELEICTSLERHFAKLMETGSKTYRTYFQFDIEGVGTWENECWVKANSKKQFETIFRNFATEVNAQKLVLFLWTENQFKDYLNTPDGDRNFDFGRVI